MAGLGRFDTDAAALKQRIDAHNKYGSGDMNYWVFSDLDLAPGASILELGCGTGKQTLPLAQAVGEHGHILAVDLSSEALETLQQNSKEIGLENRITLLNVGFDDLKGHLASQSFDRALACYSLYYVHQEKKIFEIVHNALRLGGSLFFCGPSRANNFELKRFHSSLSGISVQETKASIFMEKVGQELARELFRTVEVSHFENQLRFDSAKGLYDYWSSHNLYDESIDAEFKIASQTYFKNQQIFITTKRVIGVKAIK